MYTGVIIGLGKKEEPNILRLYSQIRTVIFGWQDCSLFLFFSLYISFFDFLG